MSAYKVRSLTFEQATARYVHRFTGDYIPDWAKRPHKGKYYAPQFRTDREWYDNTRFPKESGWLSRGTDCYTTGQTWPLGHWLAEPFTKRQLQEVGQ